MCTQNPKAAWCILQVKENTDVYFTYSTFKTQRMNTLRYLQYNADEQLKTAIPSIIELI